MADSAGAIRSLPHSMFLSALLFLIISVSLRDWSNSEATRENESGKVVIGLFSACADMPCVPQSDDDNAECRHPIVFSAIGECRQGHCINSKHITVGSDWNHNNLCDKAATSAGFAILAIFLTFSGLMFTSWRKLAGRKALYGYGAWLSFLAALSSLISWSVWIDWNRKMNDEPSVDREGPLIAFEKLSIGPGVSMQIVSSLMLFANVFFCRFQWTCFEKEKDEEVGMDDYDRADINRNTSSDPVLNNEDTPQYLRIGRDSAEGGAKPPVPGGKNASTPI